MVHHVDLITPWGFFLHFFSSLFFVFFVFWGQGKGFGGLILILESSTKHSGVVFTDLSPPHLVW